MRTSLSLSIAALTIPAWLSVAHAVECDTLYTYKANITDVYDADTVTADVDLGFRIWIREEKLRLHGINAPEVRGDEREEGLRSRDALRELILGKDVTICTVKDKREKYGRYLATIFIGDTNVNDWLVTNGYAVHKDY